MNNVLADFLFKVALMIAGYFFACSTISYGIEHYFRIKNKTEGNEVDTVEGGE